jgi:CRP-like cAMP-binding protein
MDRDSHVARLADLALFADLSWAEVEAIAHTFEEGDFAAGQRVLRQGLGGSALYVVIEGRATVVLDGSELAPLERGDFFGEISVLIGEPPSADVIADTLLRCLVVPGGSVEPFLLAHPPVMLRMLKAEARRLRDANRWR